jgi:hypothetical protein
MSDNGYRCGHAPCECTVMDSSAYCSEACEKAAGSNEAGMCPCGHEACEHRKARGEQASAPGYAGPT